MKAAAPIVLPPQACALALGAIEDKVVARTDAKAGEGNLPYSKPTLAYSTGCPILCPDNWAVAPSLTATLSCDHRVVDGAVGAQWLAAFKALVENPLALML